MKDKLFLTGDRGIGKSTCIDRVLEGLSCPVGGFRTRFGDAQRQTLLLSDIAGEHACIAARIMEKGWQVETETFDVYGSAAIRRCPAPALLVMDELGRLERDAPAFQRTVIDALDGDIPVLGVLRVDAYGWLDAVRGHDRVEVLTVTAENRDFLPVQLKEKLAMLGIG